MADIYNSLPDSIKAETVGFSDGRHVRAAGRNHGPDLLYQQDDL